MKPLCLISFLLITLNLQAQFSRPQPEQKDSTSFEQEMFTAKTRFVYAASFAATGTTLVFIGKEIQRGNIKTTLHPDNAFWPGYAFIGVAAITAVNAWFHLKRAEFIADEYGVGVRIPLKFTL